MAREVVAAGKDQAIGPGFVAGIGEKILKGDDSGSKTAAAISTGLSQLRQRGELTLAENAVEQAAANIGVNSAKDVEQLKLQLRGKYAQLVQKKVAADPTYDIASNLTADLEQARDSIVDALSQGPSKTSSRRRLVLEQGANGLAGSSLMLQREPAVV